MKFIVERSVAVLDFDCEMRPLSYLGQDFTTAEITAIAAGWVGKRDIHCWVLGEQTSEEMLSGFLELYDQADIVTGHYIRNHDLPTVNGALMEFGLPTLRPKLTSDTKNDLIRRRGISASQESLGGMLGIAEPKVGMSQTKWREANRLTPEGLKLTRERVVGDVRQHKALRAKLAAAGMLKPPRMWYP